MQLAIGISRRQIIGVMMAAILFLTAANCFHQFSWLVFEQDYKGLGWKFDVADDTSIPTWYASASLAFCALLLWLVSIVERIEKRGYVRHWQGLSLIFLFLSLDETAALHEWSGEVVKRLGFAEMSSFLYYQWVVVGGLATLILGFVYMRFFFAQPIKMRWLFFLAAAVFIGSALVVEMVNARIDVLYGGDSALYNVMTALEEFGEMAGVLIFAYALLQHLEAKVEGISLQIAR